MKEVGRIWQNITKDELDYFKQKSQEDMQRYLKEHEKFICEINDMRAKCKSSRYQDTSESFPDADLLLGLDSIHILDDNPKSHQSDHPSNLLRDEEVKDTTPVDGSKRRKVDYNSEYHHNQANDFLMQGTPLKCGKIYQHSLFGQNPAATASEDL